MTPAEQDLIIGRGYSLVVDLLLTLSLGKSENYQRGLSRVTETISREIEDQKIGVSTQVLYVIASFGISDEERLHLAKKVLLDSDAEELQGRYHYQITPLFPYIELSDNLTLLGKLKKDLKSTETIEIDERRRCLSYIRAFLTDLERDSVSYLGSMA